MRKWTYTEIKDLIETELDLKDETFITVGELLKYTNLGIDAAEAEIHTLYEDYFLANASFTLVGGTNKYDLPSDIYANKIRGVIYDDGSDTYAMKRIRRFQDIPVINDDTTSEYSYLLTNDSTDGVQINFFPNIRAEDAGSGRVTLWYIRNATELVADDDECDIPEFIDFVLQFVRVKVYEKEGHPSTGNAQTKLEYYRKQMIDTLSQMVDDGDTSLEADTSFYKEMN